MEIIQEKNGTELVIKLVGKLNILSAGDLEEALKTALDDVNELVFDFGELTYLTSSGIRVLALTCAAMNENGKKMKIINAQKNEPVYEVLRITNLLEALNVM